MRGVLKLESIFKVEEEKQKKKGRSERLIEVRNEALAYRYSFYSEFTNIHYEEKIKLLSKDFFLSVVTIPQILSKESDTIKAIKSQNITIKGLKNKYPFFNWNPKELLKDYFPYDKKSGH